MHSRPALATVQVPMSKEKKATQRGHRVAVSVVLILAAVRLQGGPQSPGCRSELGHKEGRDSPGGLYQGARPAPAASAELAFTQESFHKEEPTARGTAASQTSQTRLLVAKPETSFAEDLGSAVSKHLSMISLPPTPLHLLPRSVLF